MLNDILKLDQLRDFPFKQTLYQLYDLDAKFDLHRITRGFHKDFAAGKAFQHGLSTNPYH